MEEKAHSQKLKVGGHQEKKKKKENKKKKANPLVHSKFCIAAKAGHVL